MCSLQYTTVPYSQYNRGTTSFGENPMVAAGTVCTFVVVIIVAEAWAADVHCCTTVCVPHSTLRNRAIYTVEFWLCTLCGTWAGFSCQRGYAKICCCAKRQSGLFHYTYSTVDCISIYPMCCHWGKNQSLGQKQCSPFSATREYANFYRCTKEHQKTNSPVLCSRGSTTRGPGSKRSRVPKTATSPILVRWLDDDLIYLYTMLLLYVAPGIWLSARVRRKVRVACFAVSRLTTSSAVSSGCSWTGRASTHAKTQQ